MKIIVTLLLLLPLLEACAGQPQSAQEAKMIEALSWAESDNPEQAAEQAWAAGDGRLLSFARRGAIPPGIEVEMFERYRQSCGIRLMPGSGDIIYGRQQLKLLRKAQEYASRYNRVMAQRCLGPAPSGD